MSAHSSGEWLLLFCTALVVAVRVFYLVKRFWNYPLDHGTGFFLGVEVPSGFYSAEGRKWLTRYRTVLLGEHVIEALALAAVLTSGRWNLLPVWAGGVAIIATAMRFAFTSYTRATLGAHPPVRSCAAVSLERRRLSEYVSWRIESLMGLVTAASWGLLFFHPQAHVHWNVPVILTYVILGLCPFKVLIVRNSFPLPVDRTEEHERWLDAQRRYSLQCIDTQRWFFLVILVGYAVGAAWRTLGRSSWFHWPMIGASLAVWLVMMVIITRGQNRLTAMGRDLRPPGSWSTPFRPARLMLPGYAPKFALWFGGLVLLLVIFRD